MKTKNHLTIKQANDLFVKNIGLAHRFCHLQRHKNGLDDEEVFSLACEGLMRATRHWNPKRGALSTIAWRCMWTAVNDARKKMFKYKSHEVRLPVTAVADKSRGVDAVDDREEASRMLEVGMSVLDDREKYILYARQESILEKVGEAIGVTRERVRQIEVRAKAKFIEHVNSEMAA